MVCVTSKSMIVVKRDSLNWILFVWNAAGQNKLDVGQVEPIMGHSVGIDWNSIFQVAHSVP